MSKETKVDGYVSSLIQNHAEELGVDIDPKNPTREKRLELALKMDDAGIDPWYGMEIMVGRRISSLEQGYTMLAMTRKMGMMDKMKFYDGF